MYEITKRFTGGLLNGLVITEKTRVKWFPGTKIDRPVGGSPYVIVSCKWIGYTIPAEARAAASANVARCM